MMLAEDEEKKRDDKSNEFNPVGNARNAIAKLTGQTLFMQKCLAGPGGWMDVSKNQKRFPVFLVKQAT